MCISTVLDLYFLWDWIGRFSRGSNRMYIIYICMYVCVYICLIDIATDDIHVRAQAQACVGDRCTGRDAYARERHARLHIRCHPALVQLAYKHSFG